MKRWYLSLLLVLIAFPAYAINIAEEEKINQLLGLLETPKLVVIVDGKEHTGIWAKQQFEFQKKMSTVQVSTAREFIETIASKTPTGSPYTIRLPNKELVDSGEWFRQKLAEMEIEAVTPTNPNEAKSN